MATTVQDVLGYIVVVTLEDFVSIVGQYRVVVSFESREVIELFEAFNDAFTIAFQ